MTDAVHMLQAGYGSYAIGLLLSGLGLLGTACVLALPETKDRSLRTAPAPRPAAGPATEPAVSPS